MEREKEQKMSEEQQIEELAQIIHNRLNPTDKPCRKGECCSGFTGDNIPCECISKEIARLIIKAGYRRQTEVVREIFEEIETCVIGILEPSFQELRKKYE